jgi:hypothetical protein
MRISKFIFLSLMPLVASCGPNAIGYSQDLDDLITREACNITVDKSAVSANTDIDISVKLKPMATTPLAPVIHVHPAPLPVVAK